MKNIVYFAILTTLVVASWVIFGIYHNYTNSTIGLDTASLIKPISPGFDHGVIDKIHRREKIEVNLSETVVDVAPTATATGSSQQASPSKISGSVNVSTESSTLGI